MDKKRYNVIVGIFESAGDARRAIRDLRDANFSDEAIGLLTHDRDGDPDVKAFKELEGNRASAGAAIGTAAGAGGAALWALGIAAGILPAIGPVISGGILIAIATSAAAGAGAGALVGTLIGLGLTDEDAAYYDEAFRRGRTIVVVTAGDRDELARIVLQAHRSETRLVTRPTTLGEDIASSVDR